MSSTFIPSLLTSRGCFPLPILNFESPLIKLTRFCVLSNLTHHPPPSHVLNVQYEAQWNTKQNYMQNACLSYIGSQGLKVVITKSYMLPPVFLFVVVLFGFYIHQHM